MKSAIEDRLFYDNHRLSYTVTTKRKRKSYLNCQACFVASLILVFFFLLTGNRNRIVLFFFRIYLIANSNTMRKSLILIALFLLLLALSFLVQPFISCTSPFFK